MLRKNKLSIAYSLASSALMFALVACKPAPTKSTDAPTTKSTDTQHLSTNEKSADEKISQLTQTDWRFVRWENFIHTPKSDTPSDEDTARHDKQLALLDGRATISIRKHASSPTQLLQANITPEKQYTLTAYAGCTAMTGIVGLKPAEAKILPSDSGFEGNAPNCGDTTEMEVGLANLFGLQSFTYHFEQSHLYLTDTLGRVMIFKPTPTNNTDTQMTHLGNHAWQLTHTSQDCLRLNQVGAAAVKIANAGTPTLPITAFITPSTTAVDLSIKKVGKYHRTLSTLSDCGTLTSDLLFSQYAGFLIKIGNYIQNKPAENTPKYCDTSAHQTLHQAPTEGVDFYIDDDKWVVISQDGTQLTWQATLANTPK
ncbi:MAG: hypothetical protein Q4B88_02650 [Moraxella sp.]|nr:hypothetical protein [Moraxella sp.]